MAEITANSPISHVDVWIDELTARLAQQLSRSSVPLYLWCRPSSGSMPGDVVMATDGPAEYVLAWSERFHPLGRVGRFQFQARQILRGLPLLPTADPEVDND